MSEETSSKDIASENITSDEIIKMFDFIGLQHDEYEKVFNFIGSRLKETDERLRRIESRIGLPEFCRDKDLEPDDFTSKTLEEIKYQHDYEAEVAKALQYLDMPVIGHGKIAFIKDDGVDLITLKDVPLLIKCTYSEKIIDRRKIDEILLKILEFGAKREHRIKGGIPCVAVIMDDVLQDKDGKFLEYTYFTENRNLGISCLPVALNNSEDPSFYPMLVLLISPSFNADCESQDPPDKTTISFKLKQYILHDSNFISFREKLYNRSLEYNAAQSKTNAVPGATQGSNGLTTISGR